MASPGASGVRTFPPTSHYNPNSQENPSSNNMQDIQISRPPGPLSPMDFNVNDTRNCNLHHNRLPVNQPAKAPRYSEILESCQLCQRTVEIVATKEYPELPFENDKYMESTTTISTSSSSGRRSNPFLPHQLILHHILARLPPKYLFQCSCVCKLWFTSILRDPHFAASHFLRYSQKNPCLLYKFGGQGEIDSFYLSSGGKESDRYVDLHKIETIGSQHKRELIGSCNGLVCLFNIRAQIIEVCNPTRRQILAIFPPHPIMAAANQHSTKSYRFGFGYDSLSEEYKVAFILLEMSECMVFSLGTKNAYWRDIAINKDVLAKLSDDGDHFKSGAATFCNGALYWSQGKELVSFDLRNEKFQVIQLPGLARFHELFSSRLLVHKGSLCWVNMSAACTSTLRWSVELFVLKDENCKQVWKKETFLLPYVSPGRSNQLVDFLDQLLLHRTVMKGQVGIYNLHRRKEKIVRNPSNLLSSVEHWVCSSHVENFLSLQTFVQQGVPFVKGINF